MPVYKNKKTNQWKYRTYANDIYGNRKQYEKGGFKTKREAEKAESDLKLLDYVSDTDINFEKLWLEYDEHIKLKLKVQSYRSLKNRIEKHLLPYFKDYKLTAITPRVYTKWQIEIEKKNYSYKYNSALHGAMRTILNYAIKFHGLKENVASLTGNFRRKEETSKKVDFWTLEEYQKFINCVDDNLYYILFETLYYTGLRFGECLALTWNDFKNDSLDINKTLTRNLVDNKKVINTPKTSSSIRTIKLDNDLIKLLNILKQKYMECVEFTNDWYIFGGIKPLSQTTVTRKKNIYSKIANVKKIRIHDFRHSHASLLLSQGVPITVISERLGHSDIDMTLNTYSHIIPSDVDKAINILNNLKSQN